LTCKSRSAGGKGERDGRDLLHYPELEGLHNASKKREGGTAISTNEHYSFQCGKGQIISRGEEERKRLEQGQSDRFRAEKKRKESDSYIL